MSLASREPRRSPLRHASPTAMVLVCGQLYVQAVAGDSRIAATRVNAQLLKGQ